MPNNNTVSVTTNKKVKKRITTKILTDKKMISGKNNHANKQYVSHLDLNAKSNVDSDSSDSSDSSDDDVDDVDDDVESTKRRFEGELPNTLSEF